MKQKHKNNTVQAVINTLCNETCDYSTVTSLHYAFIDVNERRNHFTAVIYDSGAPHVRQHAPQCFIFPTTEVTSQHF